MKKEITKKINRKQESSGIYVDDGGMAEQKQRIKNMTIVLTVIVAAVTCFIVSSGGLSSAIENMTKGVLFVVPTVAGLGSGFVVAAFAAVFIYFYLHTDAKAKEHYDSDKAVDTGGFMTEEQFQEYADKYIFPEPDPIPGPVPFDPKNDEKMYSWNMPMSQHFSRPIRGVRISGNSNVLVIGGSGAGKSRFFIKPNMLEMNSSFVVTDPSGEMIYAIGNVLKNHGYKIKIFNISDMAHSNCYNPFKYIRNDAGVKMLVECLINNTSKGEGGGDNQFFVDAEKLLYSACIFYLRDFCQDVTKQNFASVIDMINASQVNENDPSFESPLDGLFADLPQSSLAYKYYKSFKQAAGKTLKSIIISCTTRLQPFLLPSVVNLTSTDELDLKSMGHEKTALFIITPQADRSFSFLASMLYSQLFETLYNEGEELKAKTGDERLPVNVRCLMDEFANIGEVPEFPSKLATMRKYNISATVVVQDITQLEAMYKDEWHTLVSNCSTLVFLGTTENDTLKMMSEKLGKKTIRVKGDSLQKNGSSQSYNTTGREVMSPAELSLLPTDECIVFTQSFRPVRDKKYEYTKHPYYNQTGDADPKNAFHYKEYKIYDVESKTKFTGMIKAMTEAQRKLAQAKRTNIYLNGEPPKMTMDIFKMINDPASKLDSAKRKELLTGYIKNASRNFQPLLPNHIGLSVVDYLPPAFFEETAKVLAEQFTTDIVIVVTRLPGLKEDYGMRGLIITRKEQNARALPMLFKGASGIDELRKMKDSDWLYIIVNSSDDKAVERLSTEFVEDAKKKLGEYVARRKAEMKKRREETEKKANAS